MRHALLLRDGSCSPHATPAELRHEPASESSTPPSCARRGVTREHSHRRRVAQRVLRQLRHDPRTIAFDPACAMPARFPAPAAVRPPFRLSFQQIGTPLLGHLPLYHDVPGHVDHDAPRAHLRNARTADDDAAAQGRHPAGYAAAFALLALVQATLISASRSVCSGSTSPARSGWWSRWRWRTRSLECTLGLFVSAFAQTEFQAVQFMPAFVLPQILLCGLFVARSEMATWLRAISYVMPLTYAYDALARTAASTFDLALRAQCGRRLRLRRACDRARRRDPEATDRLAGTARAVELSHWTATGPSMPGSGNDCASASTASRSARVSRRHGWTLRSACARRHVPTISAGDEQAPARRGKSTAGSVPGVGDEQLATGAPVEVVRIAARQEARRGAAAPAARGSRARRG